MMAKAVALMLAGLLLAACRGPVDGRPEARCFAACQERAGARCNDDQCARGCRFIIDRIVEREDPTVIACVASGKGPCGDETWADCAARIGVHVDGGPPVPAPLPEVREEEEAAEKGDSLDDDEKPTPRADAGAKPGADAGAKASAGKPTATKPPAKSAPKPKGPTK
jgi:hypothetical protein